MPDNRTPRMDDPARDAHIPLPGEQQAHGAADAEEHLLMPDVDLESNKLHASGRVCARCGHPFRPEDDVRRTARGTYQHEVCGLS
jgi:hypothetical protein